MKDIKKLLEEKKKQLADHVTAYGQMQENLNQLAQLILKAQGGIDQLNELTKENEDLKKE